MNASLSLDSRKKAALSVTPARSLTPTHPSAVLTPKDGEAGRAESLDHDVLTARRFGHDFSQVAVSPSSLQVADSSPLKSAPIRCPFGGACHTCPARVQTKLAINQPGDVQEQEADRVTEQVMRMPDPDATGVSRQTPDLRVQRSCPECEVRLQRQPMEDEEEEPIQAKAASGQTPAITAAVQSHINTSRTGGQPLPESARGFFEPRFGYSLSQVRMHTDAQATETARELKAEAYTIGRHIYFAEGRYRPETTEGRRLLAHELAHTMQQERHGLAVQREPDPIPVTEPQQITQDTRTAWRTRVDTAVRTLFGLSGPGLTAARVAFVEPAAFAARVPASAMVEVLLDLFMSPPPFSEFHDILRHNRLGLAGPTRLRQFIEQGIAAGSFTYSVLDPVAGRRFEHKVTPQQLIAENVAGITSVQGGRASRRVVMQVPGDVETLVHEACHFYVSNNFRNRASQDPDRNLFRFRKYHLLMEGFAEYFARQVMRANRDVFGQLHVQAYQAEVETVWRLIVTMEEPTARAACFQGNTAALDRLNQAITLNVEHYPLMVPSFMIGSGTVQPKLTVNQPGDEYEEEADRIAERIMRMPERPAQRKTEKEEELHAKALVRRITPLTQGKTEGVRNRLDRTNS